MSARSRALLCFSAARPTRRYSRTYGACSYISLRTEPDTPTPNHTVSALRFFFRVTLKRYAIVEHTTFIHEPRKLPVVLSPEEVARLLNAAPGLKYKAALSASPARHARCERRHWARRCPRRRPWRRGSVSAGRRSAAARPRQRHRPPRMCGGPLCRWSARLACWLRESGGRCDLPIFSPTAMRFHPTIVPSAIATATLTQSGMNLVVPCRGRRTLEEVPLQDRAPDSAKPKPLGPIGIGTVLAVSEIIGIIARRSLPQSLR